MSQNAFLTPKVGVSAFYLISPIRRKAIATRAEAKVLFDLDKLEVISTYGVARGER